MNRSKTFVVVAMLSLGACTPSEGLRFTAPSRLLQAATSTDAALCDRLAVDFTFREQNAAGADLDRVPLEPAGTCEWELTDDGEYARGVYDMLVRFRPAGNFRGAPDCEEQDNDVWVGAHYLGDVEFPFAAGFAGFTDDTFLSVPADDDADLLTIEDRFGFSTRSFDLDADGFDNLVEVSGESHPCRANAPPVVSIDVQDPVVDEGQPISIDVSSVEVDGLQHDVIITARHNNGAAFAPETAKIRLRTYTPDDFLADDPPTGQGWSWDVNVVDAMDDNPGAASWTVRFLPDEPFVGEVTFTALAVGKDENVGIADPTTPAASTVNNIPDAAKLLVDVGNDVLEPVERLAFAEEFSAAGPTTLRLRAESGDIGVELTGAITLGQAPASMVIGEDFSYTTLTYVPTNAEALDDELSVELIFTDGDGNDIAQTYPIDVIPTYNNPVYFPPLEAINTNLSDVPFSFKRFRFDVVDPDRVSGDISLEPTCGVEIWPEDDEACVTTCCQQAWADLECETDGAIEGDTWHMVATLTPAADYFTVCGDEPIFTVKLAATDKAPSEADPDQPTTVATKASCYNDDDENCREHLRFNTAGAVAHEVVSGWGGSLSGSINGTSGALIDSSTGMSLMSVILDGTRTVAAVDLNSPPTVRRLYTSVEFDQFDDFVNYTPAGVVDTVNHRAVAFGWNDAGQAVALFDLEPPYDVQTWNQDTFCVESGNPGATPVVDSLGNLYVPCGAFDEGSLVRIDGAGAITQINLAPDIEGGNGGHMGSAILEDEVGAEWLIWPHNNGLGALELSTFDDPSPHVGQAVTPTEYNSGTVEGWAVPDDRGSLVLVYNHWPTSLDAGSIIRVRVESGGLVVDGPLPVPESATNNGSLYHRVVLRGDEPGEQPEEPDMLVTGGASGTTEKVYVDLDSFTITPPRPEEDFYGLGLQEVFVSPDPHFYAGVMTGGSGNDYTDGVVLFPWDNTEGPVSYDLGVPTAFEVKQGWVTVDTTLNVMVINEGPQVDVVYFLQAP